MLEVALEARVARGDGLVAIDHGLPVGDQASDRQRHGDAMVERRLDPADEGRRQAWPLRSRSAPFGLSRSVGDSSRKRGRTLPLAGSRPFPKRSSPAGSRRSPGLGSGMRFLGRFASRARTLSQARSKPTVRLADLLDIRTCRLPRGRHAGPVRSGDPRNPRCRSLRHGIRRRSLLAGPTDLLRFDAAFARSLGSFRCPAHLSRHSTRNAHGVSYSELKVAGDRD